MKTTLPIEYLFCAPCLMGFPSIFFLHAIPFPIFIFSSLLFFPLLVGRLKVSSSLIPLSYANSILSYSDAMKSSDLGDQILDAFPTWCLSYLLVHILGDMVTAACLQLHTFLSRLRIYI